MIKFYAILMIILYMIGFCAIIQGLSILMGTAEGLVATISLAKVICGFLFIAIGAIIGLLIEIVEKQTKI